jgi:hypothetical protein
MRTILIIVGLLISITALQAQKSYVIEYDKLNDITQYFRVDVQKGKRTEVPVSEIQFENNDLIHLRVTNVNEMIFDMSVAMGKKEMNDFGSASPIIGIISAFSPFGGPALNMITGLAGSVPSRIVPTRGDEDAYSKEELKMNQLMLSAHATMTELSKLLLNFEKSSKILYSKEHTYEEIVSALTLTVEEFPEDAFNQKLENLALEMKELTEMSDETEFSTDKLSNELERLTNNYDEFIASFTDEEGNIVTRSFSDVLYALEQVDFVITHTFIAQSRDEWRNYVSNDFLISFTEKSLESEEEMDYNSMARVPVEYSKLFTLKAKEQYAPHWALGIDFVAPFSGRVGYDVREISGDSWSSIPDSINITENSINPFQMVVGTKLTFDIPTKGIFQPNISFGAGIGGLMDETAQKNFNFLLGAGLSLKSFPWVTLNTSFSLSQLQTLKSEYALGRTFVKPDFIGYGDYSGLFSNKFKPGWSFGISFQF